MHTQYPQQPHPVAPTMQQRIPTVYEQMHPAEQAGVPAEYRLPDDARRPYGAAPYDVRGKAYLSAVGAFSAAVLSLAIVLLFSFASMGIGLIPAIVAITFGIIALRQSNRFEQGPFFGKTRSLAIWAIVLGIVGVLLSIGTIFLSVWFYSDLSSCDIYETGSTEYEQCIEGSSTTS
mgnify:CR=1 FL=1